MDFKEVIKNIIHYGLENVLSKYYSSYRAFVHSNDDPKNMNRLQLIIPVVNENIADETWAYPKNNYNSNGGGSHILPKPGDMVWVEFEFGDLDNPIWSHSHYGENEKPKEFSSDDIFGFKTPKGNIIYISDEEDTEFIRIKSNTNQLVELKKDIIQIVNTDNSKIVINKNSLNIESDRINLGEDSSEKAVLGNTLLERINTLINLMTSMNQDISTHSHPGHGVVTPTANDFISINEQLNQLSEDFEDILTNKTYLE